MIETDRRIGNSTFWIDARITVIDNELVTFTLLGRPGETQTLRLNRYHWRLMPQAG